MDDFDDDEDDFDLGELTLATDSVWEFPEASDADQDSSDEDERDNSGVSGRLPRRAMVSKGMR